MSRSGVKVTFEPSDKDLPAHLDGWTLYDVYVESAYAGLVADTGIHSDYGGTRIWKPLEGNAYQLGDELSREEAASVFVRWYHGSRRQSGG